MKISHLAALATIALATFGITGCAADSSGDGEHAAVSSSEAISGCRTWGMTFVTNATTVMRDVPAYYGTPIQTLPPGNLVTMADSCPENGFYRVYGNFSVEGYVPAERLDAL